MRPQKARAGRAKAARRLLETLCAKNMNAIFKFSTITILLIVLISLVLFFAIGHSVYSGKGSSVKFVNASDQVIKSAIVSVSGKSCSVKGLGVGGEVNCYFQDLYDDSYSVSVILDSGKVFINESMGYVTGGIDFNDTITFNNDGGFNLDSSIGT